MPRIAILCMALLCGNGFAVQLNSQHAIVVSDETGEVLFSKDADAKVPIASLTKLMSAMVVLDSQPDMNENIVIQKADVDVLKHSASRVSVGTILSRKKMFRLALMSSDNRAAASLARTYPGSVTAFIRAVDDKIKVLGMRSTVIKEPTGLSPENRSSAVDLAKMAVAASRYPAIVEATTHSSDLVKMNGRTVMFHNTNRLVGSPGWDVLLSKTGFTNEAGHCLIMRLQLAGKRATVVLLNARANSSRTKDARNVRKLLGAYRGPVRIAVNSLATQVR